MATKKGAGRPSDYRKEYARKAYQAAKYGANDSQIAAILGIDRTTLIRWKKQFEEFRNIICKGKNEYLFNPKKSLSRRAVGYRYAEVTKEHGVITKIVTKHMPASVNACIALLKNSKTKEWD